MAETISKMQIKVISPIKIFYEGEADFIEFNTSEGEVGIYPMHVPTVSMLVPGVLRIHNDGEVKEAALHSGFVEVLSDRVTFLAEAAEWPWEIDKNRAEAAKIRAERKMEVDQGDDKTSLALKRSIVRIEMADRK